MIGTICPEADTEGAGQVLDLGGMKSGADSGGPDSSGDIITDHEHGVYHGTAAEPGGR